MKILNGSIESIDINKITKEDILSMYEIERDTWSHFMGEYVKCTNCKHISSKEDIYGKIDINYKMKTVCALENEYGRKNIKCTCCGNATEDIRGKELLGILESRIFLSKKGFVNFYKSKINKLLGFTYGFIDSPEKTYEMEFSYHFSDKLLNDFIGKFGSKDLLTLSGVCIKPEAQNIHIIYELIKQFHCSIDSSNDDLIGVGEAIIDTSAHKIYKKMGCNAFKIDNTYLKDNVSEGLLSEIVYHKNVIKDYRSIKNMDLSSFLNHTKNLVQKV